MSSSWAQFAMSNFRQIISNLFAFVVLNLTTPPPPYIL